MNMQGSIDLAVQPRAVAAEHWPGFTADDVVHVLAQLPAGVSGQIWCSLERQARLLLIARAYGIGGRLRLHASESNARWAIDGADGIGEVFPEPSPAELLEYVWPAGAERSPASRPNVLLAGHRVCLVTNYPAHYRLPLFSGMANRARAAGAEFKVLFLRSGEPGRPWLSPAEPEGFDHAVLRSVRIPVRRRRPPLAPVDLIRELRSFAPTLVVVGGFSPAVSSRVGRYAASAGIPFGIWSGETADMPTAQTRARRRQRRRLVRRADFGIAYGSRAAGYLASLDGSLPVVLGRNTSGAFPALRPRRDNATVELVCVGDLSSPRKGIDVLIGALDRLPNLPCRLTVIGDGEQRPRLEEQAAGDWRIRFLRALDPPDVRKVYEASDICLFPTRSDVFGLVLVEAMSAGLATVVSSAAGGVPDLAVAGVNCLVVAPDDQPGWASAIEALVLDRDIRTKIGNAASETISRRWTLEHSVEAMMAGLRLGALRAGEKEFAQLTTASARGATPKRTDSKLPM